MNIIKELLKEHSRKMVDSIVDYIGESHSRFAQLVDIFMEGPYRVTQRAAWPLSYCVEKHPHLIGPHLSRLIKNLRKPGLHDSVARNTMRFLQFVTIPKGLHGEVTDIAFRLLVNPKSAIAIRVFSMTVLANCSHSYPELKKELRVILEDQLPFAGPAFKSRAKKILRTLDSNSLYR